jgi:hypothetical protein
VTAYCEICGAEATELCSEHATFDSLAVPLDTPSLEEMDQLRQLAAKGDWRGAMKVLHDKMMRIANTKGEKT